MFKKYSVPILVFIILTVVTQVGGVIYLISFYLSKKINYKFFGKTFILFMILYSIFTIFIIPYIAPVFGREQVKNTEIIKPTNKLFTFLNRHYVTPELNQSLFDISNDLRSTHPSLEIRYLDGNFPFLKYFPMLPHLSHNDGRKIDISLVYRNEDGVVVNDKVSRSGYGVFEDPTEEEFNQNEFCKDHGYFQYDYPKYLTLGKINKNLLFSEQGTSSLMNSILSASGINKVFLEKHLMSRLELEDERLRFQGCSAVRHDDHIHIQL